MVTSGDVNEASGFAPARREPAPLYRAWPRHLLLLAGIVLLAAALRFFALSRESLWFDEAFSVSVAEWDPKWVILKLTELGLRSTDRNLFHLMLHYVILLGRSEVLVRAIPAISGILSVIALYALGKRLMGQTVALLAAFLLAVSPMHVWYSREARGYALLALFGLLAAYFMLRALSDNRIESWLGYVVLSACAAYTHSFGVLVIAALNLFAVLRFIMLRGPRAVIARWFVAQVVLGLALAPFVRELTGQTSEGWGSWIGEKYGVPTLKTLGITMGLFSFNTAFDQNRRVYVLGLLVFAVPCLVALIIGLRYVRRHGWWQERGEAVAFALIYLVAPIGALFLASQFTPLYLERYLLPFVPPYLLIVAYGLISMPRLEWRAALMLALLAITIAGLLAVYTPGQKEDWRGGAAYVAAGAQDGDMIVIYDAYASIPFDFYYQGKTREIAISRFAGDEELAQQAAAIASVRGRVWLVLSHADEKRLMSVVETKPGVTLNADRRFLGLHIVTYDVSAPR